MGATQSVEELVEHLDVAAENGGAGAQIQPGQSVVYKFTYSEDNRATSWSVAGSSAGRIYTFYDANEGAPSKGTAWWIEIESADVEVPVGADIGMDVHLDQRTATFFDTDKSLVVKILFPSTEACNAFSDEFHDKLFENMQGKGNVDLGKQDDWFFRPAAAEPMDWQPTPEEPPAAAEPTTPRLWKESEAIASEATPVRCVAVGAGDNSFLVRDDRVTVLRNGPGAVLGSGQTFQLTPPRTGGGAGLGAQTAPYLTPGKVILAQKETQMNMLTPDRKTVVAQADLERGAVVREWTCKLNGVEVPMADIENDTRVAQLEQRSTFLGLDRNRLCQWDQRTAGGIAQDLSSSVPVLDADTGEPVVADLSCRHGKDYSRGTNFTCMATSGQGYVAVGSQDGRVRLYGSKKGLEAFEFKAASTSVSSLGCAITAIDVSTDGRYVVATTDRYLLVIQTSFADAKGADTNGFVSRMSSKMAPPKMLKLRAEDRVKVSPTATFSKGRLTWVTDDNATERWIAASCGNYSVLWNFRRVKAAKPTVISLGAYTVADHYTLIRKDEKVVDNAFMHDRFAATPQAKNSLLVATEHRLYNCVDEDSDFE